MDKRPLKKLYDFSTEEVRKLLHNKFVVILGDSIQRTVYKDLMSLLQEQRLLTLSELRFKGGDPFKNDHVVEFEKLSNETSYREVRQYRTDHHLVRFYFVSRVYSNYMESILEDFKAGPAPDLVILNSCFWDLNRYLDYSLGGLRMQKAFREYRENLQVTFEKLHDVLPASSLIIWSTTMPQGKRVKGAYLKTGMKNKTTPQDILRANFEGATLASCYQLDVLDLNFCFRFFEEHRVHDGVHWNQVVHRYISQLLLTHAGKAWGVDLKTIRPQNGIVWNGNANWHCGPRSQPLLRHPPPRATYANGTPFAHFNPSHDPNFQRDSVPLYGSSSGYLNFEHDPEEMRYGRFYGPADYAQDGPPQFAHGGPPDYAHGGPPEYAHSGPPEFAQDGPPEYAHGGPPEYAHGEPPDYAHGEPPGYAHGGPPDYAHGGPPDFAHGGPDFAHGEPPDYAHGEPPDYAHGGPPDFAHGEPPDFAHGGPPEYAHSGGLAGPSFPVDQVPGGGWRFPPPPPPGYVPNGGQGVSPRRPRRSPRGFRGTRRNARVMRHQRFHGEHYRPYSYPPAGAGGHPPFQAPPYVGWRGW